MRRSSSCLAIIAVATITLSACESEPTYPSGVALTTTDGQWIETDLGFPAFELPYRIENRRIESIHIEACASNYGVGIERNGPDGWETSIYSLCASTRQRDTVALAPGTLVTDSARVFEPGTYRLVLPFGPAPDMIGADSTFSPAFTVK